MYNIETGYVFIVIAYCNIGKLIQQNYKKPGKRVIFLEILQEKIVFCCQVGPTKYYLMTYMQINNFMYKFILI